MEVKFFHLHCTVVHKKSGVIIHKHSIKAPIRDRIRVQQRETSQELISHEPNQTKQNMI